MNNISKIFNLIRAVFSLIFPLINQFETPGCGKDKKKAILNIVAIFCDKLGQENLTISKEKILNIAGEFIDIVVGFYNIVGWVKYDSPYRQFLGDSLLEKKTIPIWEKLFKGWGIYNQDFHEKFREQIHSGRYKVYIDLVEGYIIEKIESVNRKKIDGLMKEKFPRPEFKIEDNR